MNIKFDMIRSLSMREISARYKGSILGVLWSLITPLFNLAIYTFVFGTIFRAKWSGTGQDASTSQFALILFAGLAVHQLLGEVLSKAPTLILSNQNYVKKMVFPLEILVPVSLITALYSTLTSFGIILAFMPFVFGGIPITMLYIPVILAPLCIMLLGIGWFLSSLGTYIRDVSQIIAPIIMALLFLAPIFFPSTALPIWMRPWIKLNPITVPVEQMHNIMIYGRSPDFLALGIYTIVACAVAVLGYFWFQKTRKGFADVL